MTKYSGTRTILACLVALLIAPIAAPADPVVGQVNTPVAKTKRAVPAAKQMNTPMTRRVDTPSVALQSFATEAPTEACLYDDDYSTGANNNGTTFCSKKLGYQDLPPERQGRISAANVPEGYVLVLYAGPGQSGATCRVAGRNAGLDPTCNDMARGISLQSATSSQTAQVEQDRQRRVNQTASQGEGFAPQIERDRVAAAAANEARAARERQAQADRDAQAAAQVAVPQNGSPNLPPCAVKVYESDGGAFSSLSGATETCYAPRFSATYVGNALNDDIERVDVNSRYIVFIGYEHANFAGRSVRLTCGEYELTSDPENEISSVRVEVLSAPVSCGRTGRRIINNWTQ